MRIPAGRVIFSEGDDGDKMFIIQEGSVRVALNIRGTDGSHTQSTINMLYAGQSFGEMVLLDGSTRSATITSVDPGVLLVLPEQDFAQLCEANPRIGYRVMRRLASDLAYKLRSSNLLLRGNIRWQHDELGHG
jgi:CRP-like cAMP-binding protein